MLERKNVVNNEILKRYTSIQFKAAFLLLVFALNTIVGFACSVGVDMGFNSKHHHEEEATEASVHVHKDGKKHIHQEKNGSHSHDTSHQFEEANNFENSKSDEGNCCTGKVKQFQELDKTIPASQGIVHPIFFTAFVAVYYNITLLPHADIVRDIKPFVRSYHPPIPDIRIAIQSFQI